MHIEVFTPERAAAHIDDDQGFDQSKVDSFSAKMLSGAWEFDPEHPHSPLVDIGGYIHGQHRMRAVAASGVVVTFWVVKGDT